MAKSPLATEYYPAYGGNFTYGRDGRNIEMITIHHMAGRLTAQQCGAIFQTVGRCGSSNYGIGYNGEIACYVEEENTSWCNSNWDSNCKSVTIETSDNDTSWYVNDTTLDSLIRLVADISKRNGLHPLVKGVNLTWHSMYASTTCPGDYLRSKMDYICEQANAINNKELYEEIEPKQIILTKDTSLWDLSFTDWNNTVSVKDYNKGDIFKVVAKYNHPLGGVYYITDFDYKVNDYGFNVVDCEDYIEPKKEPEEEPINNDPDDKPKGNWLTQLLNLIIQIIKNIFTR